MSAIKVKSHSFQMQDWPKVACLVILRLYFKVTVKCKCLSMQSCAWCSDNFNSNVVQINSLAQRSVFVNVWFHTREGHVGAERRAQSLCSGKQFVGLGDQEASVWSCLGQFNWTEQLLQNAQCSAGPVTVPCFICGLAHGLGILNKCQFLLMILETNPVL